MGFSSQEQAVGFNSQEQEEVEGEKKERRDSVGPSSTLEMRPLFNFDIEDILKGITNFCSVYSKDMLPNRIGEDESVVINTQDYLDGGGTHWVCVVNQLDSSDAEYFDSFGVQPSDVVVDT